MFFAILILNITHPGQTLVGPDSVFPKSGCAQRRARKRAEKKKGTFIKMQDMTDDDHDRMLV
jgi:hypothetical protein